MDPERWTRVDDLLQFGARSTRRSPILRPSICTPQRWLNCKCSTPLKAKTGDPSIALAMPEKVHPESARGSYLPVELESSLLLGRIELESGKTASGRSRLENLRKTAKAKAFTLIARQAETALADVAR